MLLKSTNPLFILGTDSLICGNMRKLLLYAILCLFYVSCSKSDEDTSSYKSFYEVINLMEKEYSRYGGFGIGKYYRIYSITIDTLNHLELFQGLTMDSSYYAFGAYDIVKKKLINNAIIEKTFNPITLHEGYGVYKKCGLLDISEPKFAKTEGGFVSYSQLKYNSYPVTNIGIIVYGNGNSTICKITEEPYFSLSSPLLFWYKNSVLAYDNNKAVIIADTGEVLYELFAPWNFQAIKQGCVIKTLSYTEAVLWGGNGFERYITRYNFGDYKTGYSDIKWQVDFYEVAKIEGDVKCTYEIKSTNGNKYSCVAHITEYSGAKKDISFELDIEEGTVKI